MTYFYDMIQMPEFDYFIHEDATVENSKGRIIKPDISLPYTRIWFSRDAVKYSFYLHRVVGFLYVSNPDNLPEINHKDFNKRNCHKNNLEWCTHKYNVNHFHSQASEEYYKYLKMESKIKPVVGKSNTGTVAFVSMSEAHKNGFKKSNIFTSIRSGKPYKGYFWFYS